MVNPYPLHLAHPVRPIGKHAPTRDMPYANNLRPWAVQFWTAHNHPIYCAIPTLLPTIGVDARNLSAAKPEV